MKQIEWLRRSANSWSLTKFGLFWILIIVLHLTDSDAEQTEAQLKVAQNTSNYREISDSLFSIDIIVSGTDAGQATVESHCKENITEVALAVNKITFANESIKGDSDATLFAVSWQVMLPANDSCENLKRWDHIGTLSVPEKDGNGTLKIPFEVQYPPLWSGPPREIVTTSRKMPSVRLVCDVCSHPRVVIEWTLCNNSLPYDVLLLQNNTILIIEKMSRHHIGTYQCVASTIINTSLWTKTYDFLVLRKGINKTRGSLCRGLPDDRTLNISSNMIIGLLVIMLAITVVYYYVWKGDKHTTDWIRNQGPSQPANQGFRHDSVYSGRHGYQYQVPPHPPINIEMPPIIPATEFKPEYTSARPNTAQKVDHEVQNPMKPLNRRNITSSNNKTTSLLGRAKGQQPESKTRWRDILGENVLTPHRMTLYESLPDNTPI